MNRKTGQEHKVFGFPLRSWRALRCKNSGAQGYREGGFAVGVVGAGGEAQLRFARRGVGGWGEAGFPIAKYVGGDRD